MAKDTSKWKAWLEVAGHGMIVAILFLVMLFSIVPPFFVTIWTGSTSDWLNVLLYTVCVVTVGTLLLRGLVGKSRKEP